MKKFAVGADIGGSHITSALIDLVEKSIVRNSIATQQVNNQASAEDILTKWNIALQHSVGSISLKDLAGVGFAMPGPFDYANGIALFTHEVAKYENLYGVDVAGALSNHMGLSRQQFRFMNDATAFAIGEAWMGKAKNVNRSLSVTLGTGFGSAFVDNGLPVVERDDVPKLGCVWHLPYRNGIADDYFSTRWFIKNFFEKTNKRATGVREIADMASYDTTAVDLFATFGTGLGEFLGYWLEKFRAEMLVIGGNVTGAYHLFGSAFESALQRKGIHISIQISELTEESAIAGSAHLHEDKFWQKVQPLLSKM
jgi:glucokinase